MSTAWAAHAWCRYLGPDYGEEPGPQDVVMAAQLPALARQSFPLCMQHMFQRAHTDSHLKHFGRLQLGLFLKARLLLLPAHWSIPPRAQADPQTSLQHDVNV